MTASRVLSDDQRQTLLHRIEPNVPHVLPTVSIVVASYDKPGHLEKCLESIYQQVYPLWELIVTDDGSPNDLPREVALTYGAKWVSHPHTYDADGFALPHIARTLNSGLELATGTTVQTLQQDHVLAPDFLLWLVRAWVPNALVWGLTDHRNEPMSLSDIRSMTRTLHFPDAEVRYVNHLVYGRSLLTEMTEWRNTDGLDCAFDRQGTLVWDSNEAMVGQGHVWPDWVLSNVIGRGARLLLNPMMRLWHLEHPERPGRDRWQAQIATSYAYMQKKWMEGIWNSHARPALYDAHGYYDRRGEG